MNVETLILTLKSISDDNIKNSTLKSVISLVTDINWDNIASIIGCYSNDDPKLEALNIITFKNLGQLVWESDYVADIYHRFSFPSKIEAIRLFDKCTNLIIPHNVLVDVIKDIPSDSDKAEAVGLILGCHRALVSIDNFLPTILPLISEDGNKIKALTYIAQRNALNQKKFNEIDLKFALQNITSDSAKIECIKLFLKKVIISCMLLLEICHTFSSDSAKCDCCLEFAEKVFPIVGHAEFCRALAAEISDPEYYLKITEKLNIIDRFVQEHKPKIKNLIVQTSESEIKNLIVQTPESENKQINNISNRCIVDDELNKSMDVLALIVALRCSSDGNINNSYLESVISSVTNINWAIIPAIIFHYPNDDSRIKALNIITSQKKLGELVWESDYVADIYHLFSFPIKIDAIKLLGECTPKAMPQNVLVNVIKDIPSDSDKAQAVRRLMFELNTIRDIVQNVLPLISEDCNKIKALTYITLKKFNESDLKFAVENITSDSAKIECIKLFLKCVTISCMLLLEICHTFSSNSAKCDCISEFAKKILPIVGLEEFCQALAAEINDPDYYFKAAKILGLNNGFEGILVHELRPQKKVDAERQFLPLNKAAQTPESENKEIEEHNEAITAYNNYVAQMERKDISEDAMTLTFDKKREDDRKKWLNAYNPNNCIFGGENEPFNRPGVTLISSSTTASNNLLIIVKVFSDGSVYQMSRPI